jgi:4-amino-4-deoxy-L-arabinose transferase-like glycosyltransferase
VEIKPRHDSVNISQSGPANRHQPQARHNISHKPDIIVEPAPHANRWGYGILVVGLLSCGTLLFGLGGIPFLGPDEPRYAEVAREMFVTGDYITPRLCGCPWFEKPVLLYWMSAAFYRLLGVGELSARLPCALCALITAAFLCFALARRVSSRVAVMASMVLVTSPLFITYSRAAVMDMPLTAALSIALISFYLSATAEGRPRQAWWALAWAAAGLAVLAKGLVGVLLFGAIIILVLAVCRNGSFNNWRYWLLGIVAFLAVAAVWYLPVIRTNGYPFVQEFFINHHFKRYLTNQYHHPEPAYFYPAIVLTGLAPWVFYFIPAVTRFLGWLKQQNREYSPLYVLAAAWFTLPLVFFSFSESKLPGYILPVIPAAVLIIGLEVERAWSGQRGAALRTAGYSTSLVLLGLGAAFPLALTRLSIQVSGARLLIDWAPLAIAVLAFLSLMSGRPRAFLSGVCGSMLALILAAVMLAFPRMGDDLSSKKLSLEAADALRPGEQIAFYVERDYAPVFYAKGQVACGGKLGDILNALGTPDLTAALQSRPSLIVITQPSMLAWIQRNPSLLLDPSPIACEKDECAVRVTLRPRTVLP